MNLRSLSILSVVLAFSLPSDTSAQMLIKRGDIELDLKDIDARMSRFPSGEAAQFARDPENFQRMLTQLLNNRALAKEARELGLDRDPNVQRDLELAIEEILAIHRANYLFSPEAMPDFDQLARERYLADPGKWAVPDTRIVRHVLVGSTDRSNEEALEIAVQVRKAAEEGRSFDELVEQYSDDPGKAENAGRYTVDDPAKFDPDFAAAVGVMTKVGEITGPVRTRFGYHIIRLEGIVPGRMRSFDEVKDNIVRQLVSDYRKTARGDHLARLWMGKEEEANEELLRELPRRYGGRPEEEARQTGQ